MDLLDFYTKFNLNPSYFAYYASVGQQTLKKYQQGGYVRDVSKYRIETAVNAIVDNNLVRPKFNVLPGDSDGYRIWHKKLEEWNNNVVSAIERERS